MDDRHLLILQSALSLAGWCGIAAIALWPWLRRQPLHRALAVLVLPHTFRHLGTVMWSDALTKPTLPTEFSWWVGVGDLTTVALAWLALACLWRLPRAAVPAVWVFNTFGCLDLLHNLANGARYTVALHLEGAWFVPAFGVPGMFVVHVLIFAVLIRGRRGRWPPEGTPASG